MSEGYLTGDWDSDLDAMSAGSALLRILEGTSTVAWAKKHPAVTRNAAKDALSILSS